MKSTSGADVCDIRLEENQPQERQTDICQEPKNTAVPSLFEFSNPASKFIHDLRKSLFKKMRNNIDKQRKVCDNIGRKYKYQNDATIKETHVPLLQTIQDTTANIEMISIPEDYLEQSFHFANEQICRICGNLHSELMPIFEDNGLEYDLPGKIQKHFYTIKITPADNLPSRMCYQCVSALISWHDLFLLCEEVNKKYCRTSSKNVSGDQRQKTYKKQVENVELIPVCNIDQNNAVQVENFDFCDSFVKFRKHETNIAEPNMPGEENCYLSTHSDNESGVKTSLGASDIDVLSLNANPSSSSVISQNSDTVTVHSDSETKISEDDCNESTQKLTEKGKRKLPLLPPVCHICKKTFSCAFTKRLHIRTVHTDERPFLCNYCSFLFKRKDHMDNHIKMVHETEGNTARVKKYNLRKYLCSQCGKILSNKTVYRQHVNNVHGEGDTDVFKYECVPCDKTFDTYSKLYRHRVVLNHGRELPFSKFCEFCGLEFESEIYYMRHIWKHKEVVFCEQCSIRFENNEEFRKHIEEVHTERKNMPCMQCGKKFANKSYLHRHQRSHNTDDKPYKCEHCGWRFQKRGHLVVHMYRHTGERPFKCSVCGRGFKQKGDMRKHKAAHILRQKRSANGNQITEMITNSNLL